MSNTKPLTKEAIDEIAKKSFTDYIAGRRDSRGNPTPAPAECPASAPAKWTPHHARETARREWRARVKYLEARLRDARCSFGQDGHSDDCAACAMSEEWFDLHAPGGRSWRSSQRPDPRRRYSRAHRSGCDGCRKAWRVTVMCGMRNGVGEMWTAYGWVDPTGCAATMRRDPHGRRS